jgi:hypothetical protein
VRFAERLRHLIFDHSSRYSVNDARVPPHEFSERFFITLTASLSNSLSGRKEWSTTVDTLMFLLHFTIGENADQP